MLFGVSDLIGCRSIVFAWGKALEGCGVSNQKMQCLPVAQCGLAKRCHVVRAEAWEALKGLTLRV